MEGLSKGLEPPRNTEDLLAGSGDVQEPDEQESSLQPESLDPDQMRLEAIDRRRQQDNSRQALFFSRLGLDTHNLQHTESAPSTIPSVQDDQAPAAQAVLDESLFVPQEVSFSWNHLSTETDVPPMSPDDQNIFDLFQGLNSEGDTSPPIEQLLQNSPHSIASASQTGNAGTTAAPAANEEDPKPSAPTCVEIISSSSSASGDTDVPVEDFPDDAGDQSCPTEWPDEELEASTRADLSKRKFNSIKKWFDSLEKPSVADEIRLETARQQESARKNRVARRKALENQSELFDPEIDEPDEFTSRQVPIEQKTGSSHDVPVKPQPKKRRQNRISADEKQKSKELGLAAVLVQQKKRGPPKGAPHAIPELKNKDKMKALTHLVASLPSADQQEAKSDKRSIIAATRNFTNVPRSDGKSGWRLKGLNTSLYHYQVLGAAFMRKRESSSERPFGGLLCDIMGFGKTIQALANIIDGKPSDPEDPNKTTLIVVPSHLVTHWKTQINKHCEKKAIGDVLIYKANSRLETLDTLDTVESLVRYDVIITTYDEVRKSYPRIKVADSVADNDKLAAWWDQSYEDEIGPLHRIKFHRIILDEGHTIKNHLSSVSIAVRSLTGHFKWILSGTPVHNYLEEFYPLFDFLGVPGIRDPGFFIKNFCSDKMLMEPNCVSCRVPIMEAAYFKEDGDEKTRPATTLGAVNRKKKQGKKTTTTKKQARSSMRRVTAPQIEESDEEPDADEDTDWIKACARHMPSAKLTKIREILTEWLAQDSPGKIVIFTQFLDFVQILATMCQAENWPYVLLTGKLSLAVRENNMTLFSDKDSEKRIMIASLKAGGTGLDLSAANKCILVDLWWNEAIQEQAFCRLFRIGQESEVEFVKLIIENSIDDYLLNLQTHKTAIITGAMGERALAGRDTIEDLLRMFADVEKDPRGVLHLKAKTASRDIRIGAGFRPTFGVF
ncbi:hypothetical protein CBS63078_4882 [Aspergillus niger]|nr:hypothetical protein CBS115989_2802 [Aspergillus niger]KAI2830630.1 hypothetical protein CBS133816_3348 [Aspergillus niger]KAI2844674.1 hypothetical protein CBS11350_4593 [Aspergillus niger]KAI2858364.1 hypothetical protein CBS11232_2615 [Aspergillus niger]KAI2865792.1 hypothetical protein CBS12448_1711 [Aspergillus niger]